ncbi:MAG: PhzF family phenazine biosynthesis protein, partial [Pseudomonadales bacterium]
MSRTFYITEVFSEAPYGGNQLATVLDASGISMEEMQKIARGFNFSETTFIVGGNHKDGFDVRIFTPAGELPFAGHPTLGSAYLARQLYCRGDESVVQLNLGIGPIPVTFADDDVLWMKQKAPVFGDIIAREQVAATLGLSVADLSDTNPCQYVSTGLEFLIVPLVSHSALQ